MARLNIPIGTRFGRLVTISHTEYKKKTITSSFKSTYVKVKCDCGIEKEVMLNSLRNGNTTSCGCYNREQSKKVNTTHGLAFKHPTWSSWMGIIQRCTNPNSPSYHRYGGRGISVCTEWRNDFKAFHNWAIANGWKKGLQCDRYPDKDGNYEPSNCRWVTQKENIRNSTIAKLVYHQVLTIRNLFKIGAFTRGELSEIYKVSRHQINEIIRHKSWA